MTELSLNLHDSSAYIHNYYPLPFPIECSEPSQIWSLREKVR